MICSLHLPDVWYQHHNCSLQSASALYLLLILWDLWWSTETSTAATIIIILILNVCRLKHDNTQEERGCLWLIKDPAVTEHLWTMTPAELLA